MPERRRFIQTEPLEQRLAEEAARLRKEAHGTPPGIERERLIRKARRAEIASHLQQWLTSPGLQAPKTEYRAYLIGKDGHIQQRIDLICADDDAAKECTNLLVDDCDSDIELWQFDRKIATFVHKQ